MAALYPFIANPGVLNATFFGLINLNDRSILMVALAAVLQFFQAKIALPPRDGKRTLSPAEAASRNMVFLAPLMTLLIFYRLPSAVSLYWIVSSVVTIIQQMIVTKDLAHLREGKR